MTTSIVSISATQSALQVNSVNSLVFNSAGDVQMASQNGGQLAGMRNVIINGDMRIDQRNAGAAVTLNNAGGYASDRFNAGAFGGAGTGTASIQRVLDGPPSLPYSLKCTVTNAKVPAASDNNYIYHPIEADNCGAFAFGTTAARSATFSFWVKASIIGTYGGFVRSTVTGGSLRSYVINYTVNVANTWEYKTITVPADTQVVASGNGQGLAILFDLGSGSNRNGVGNSWQAGDFWRTSNCVNLISTLNATLQVTGVQLEAGPVATPFEYRLIGTELALCQRYFQTVDVRVPAPAESQFFSIVLPVRPRIAPTVAGGGAGFTSSPSPSGVYTLSQTTANFNTLTFTAEL